MCRVDLESAPSFTEHFAQHRMLKAALEAFKVDCNRLPVSCAAMQQYQKYNAVYEFVRFTVSGSV